MSQPTIFRGISSFGGTLHIFVLLNVILKMETNLVLALLMYWVLCVMSGEKQQVYSCESNRFGNLRILVL